MTKVDRALILKSYPQVVVAKALDQRRAAIGASRAAWAAEASVSERNLIRIARGLHVPPDATLARLKRALDRLDAGRGAASGVLAPEVVRSIFNGFLLSACAAFGVPAEIALALDPATAPRGATADEATRRAHRARAVALYLANVQAGLSQSQLAKALRIDKAAVSRALTRLEDAREEDGFEALVQRAARLMGEGEVW